MNGYKSRISGYVGTSNFITIHRADAADVSGQVSSTDGDGCSIVTKTSKVPGNVIYVYIEWKDIRGIATEGPSGIN